MAIPVCKSRFNYLLSEPIIIDEPSCFVPDQAMTIPEIVARASRGMLSDTVIYNELPDNVPDVYGDLTDYLVPDTDDETTSSTSSSETPEPNL